jgi:hypothetical protein
MNLEVVMVSFKVLFQNLHGESDENFTQSGQPHLRLGNLYLLDTGEMEQICFVVQMEYLKSSV